MSLQQDAKDLKPIYVHKVELIEIIPKLPPINPLVIPNDFDQQKDDLFLCALGFEDRCLEIPRKLMEMCQYKSVESVVFEYSTNREDNEFNRDELVSILRNFSSDKNVIPFQCDSEDFSEQFRQFINRLCRQTPNPRITFDISVCSSILLLTVLKIFLEFDIQLRIVYSEAEIYHPTKEEIESNIDKWTKEEELGLTRGVADVFISKEHPGNNPDGQPTAIIVFATFKPERTRRIISYIDESLLEFSKERITWLIGVPHLLQDQWRKDLSGK